MKTNSPFGNRLDYVMETVERWVAIPRYPDPALQRKAGIIHTLTSAIIVMALATISLTPFIFNDPVEGLSISLGIILFCLAIQTLNRLNRTNLAALIFVVVVWLFDSGLILFSGGFHSNYLVSYLTITVMGGLILGDIYALNIAGISIVTYLFFYFLEKQGLLPEPLFHFTPLALIIINVVSILLAAIVLVLKEYELNFEKLTEKEQSLSNINERLTGEISARKEAEALLRGSEKRLKSALMESPYPTMLHTGEGEILLVNTAWTRKSGYSSQQLNSLKDWLDKFFRENSAKVEENISQLISGISDQREGYYKLYPKNGSVLSWYLRWTRLPELPDGKSLILAIATDMTRLRRMESALRETEENLSKYTLVTNDGLWDWDLTTNQVDFDPRYYTMAGYEVDEFPHLLEEFRKRVHPDDLERVFSAAEAHLNGETDRFNVDFRFLKKDGSWLWVMSRGKVTVQDEYGKPLRLAGTHTDISTQKAVEEQLHQHQVHLEQIVRERTQTLNERISEVEKLNAALMNILDDYQIANQKLSAVSSLLSTHYQELETFAITTLNDLQTPLLTLHASAERLLSKPPTNLKAKELETLEGIRTQSCLVNQRLSDLREVSQLFRKEIQPAEVDVRKVVQKVLNNYAKELEVQKVNIDLKELPVCQVDAALLEELFEYLIYNSIQFTSGTDKPEIVIGSQSGESSGKIVYYVQVNGVGFDQKDPGENFQIYLQLQDESNRQDIRLNLIKAKIIVSKHEGKFWVESQKGSGTTFFFEFSLPFNRQDGNETVKST